MGKIYKCYIQRCFFSCPCSYIHTFATDFMIIIESDRLSNADSGRVRRNAHNQSDNLQLRYTRKGRLVPPKRINFQKSSKGGWIIFNPKINLADFGPLSRALKRGIFGTNCNMIVGK